MTSKTAVAALACLLCASCIKMDNFLYDSAPATLEDYDFTSEKLDGVPPERITSELIPVGDSDQQMHVIFVVRDEAKLDPRFDLADNLTVVFSHGNNSNMLKYYYRVGYWEDMGFNVLMYDYRGYGASTGETNEENVYEDVVAAYDYAEDASGGGTIVAAGYSLGGAPTTYLCSKESGREVAACFTEAAFTGTDQLVDDSAYYDFEGGWLVDTRFDNLGRIKEIDTPFLIMHGTKDAAVDFTNGERLWDAVKDNNDANRFYAVEGATHRNVPIPSYEGVPEPREYSHPDEMPPLLHDEFLVYKGRIVDFIADALGK